MTRYCLILCVRIFRVTRVHCLCQVNCRVPTLVTPKRRERYFMSTTEHAVALKLPAFWTSQPEVWFAQAEAKFNLRKIDTDETKYYYVVAALDQSTAARLIDLISNPPDKEKYSTLKTRLTNTFGLCKRE